LHDVPASTLTSTSVPAGATRPRLLLATLVLVALVASVTGSLGTPLVPQIARDFGVRLTTAQWSLTATMLASAVATPVLGRLGTGVRRRPVVLVGLAVVVLGLALSTAAPTMGVFLAGRALQGLGLALVPLTIAIAHEQLPPERTEGAVAILSVTVIGGAGLGYPLSSLLAEIGGVRFAYGVGLVLALGSGLLAARVLPRTARGEAGRVDWAGAVLLSAGMLAVLLAVTEGHAWGWASVRTLVLAAAGSLVLVAWVAWTLRSRTPLVDLRLAVRPGLDGPNLVALLAGVGMYALLTLGVVIVGEQSDALTGLALVPYSVLSVAASRLARFVAHWLGPAYLLPTGCTLYLVATTGLALAHGSFLLALLWLSIGGLGSGFTFSSLPVLIVPQVPERETGSALAFNMVLRSLGMTTGSAVGVGLVPVLGGGDAGVRGSLLVMSASWVVITAAVVLLARRTPQARP
jgi:predicted MFS family arabinose efflux permease